MSSKAIHANDFVLGRTATVIAMSIALSVSGAALGQDAPSGVDVSDFGTVTLTVKDTDLAQVLEMLAIQSKKNIIASKNVSATVTANLYDVTFDEALKSILLVNGFNYRVEGNFIYVMTQTEWDEEQKAKLRTEWEVYELDYLSATDANEFIAPLLSDVGQSSFRGDVERGYKPDVGLGGEDSYAFAAKVIVNDYPDRLDAIRQLISELDVPPHQIMVESTILQTQLDESNAFGVDFTVLGNLDFTDLTAGALSGVAEFLDPEAQIPINSGSVVRSTVGNTAGPGGLKIGILDDTIGVFIRVLDEVTDTTVLARPKVMCLNRQRAEVLVGARVGYLSTTATETSTTQTVEFLDTGIQLVFRPFVSNNGMIRMELSPSVSEASLRTVTDANGLVVTIPDELTRELTTNVRIQDGQTLVLGGLFRESTGVTRRQIPVLGDIPVLGSAFRGQDDTVDRDEIIFLITPSIVDDTSLWEQGDELEAHAEAARVGARQGLLPFSREMLAQNNNQKALASYKAGDTEKALYYTNNSLRLKPVQPEMIRFREVLTGVRERVHEGSLMQRAFDRELATELSVHPAFPDNTFGAQATKSIIVEPLVDPSEFIELERLLGNEPAVTSVQPVPAPETTTTIENGWMDPTQTGTMQGDFETSTVTIAEPMTETDYQQDMLDEAVDTWLSEPTVHVDDEPQASAVSGTSSSEFFSDAVSRTTENADNPFVERVEIADVTTEQFDTSSQVEASVTTSVQTQTSVSTFTPEATEWQSNADNPWITRVDNNVSYDQADYSWDAQGSATAGAVTSKNATPVANAGATNQDATQSATAEVSGEVIDDFFGFFGVVREETEATASVDTDGSDN